jgi:CRP/FNR family cyclic AMP-dependent transcriptional regulator
VVDKLVGEHSIVTSEIGLKTFSMLSDLTPAQQRLLADEGSMVEFPAGRAITRAGEPASRFFLIEQGAVKLEAFVSERGPVTIAVVSAGEPLGWSSLVPPFRSHFDAIALNPVKAIAFDAARILELCKADHDLGFRLHEMESALIAERLQATRLQLIGAFIGTPESKGWV